MKIVLLLSLSLWAYPAQSQQRLCDLEAVCISPADTVINGESLILRYGRKNLGPDVMFKNDTTYYLGYRIVEGKNSVDYAGAFIGGGGRNDTVYIGDSTIYRDNYSISFSYPGLTEPLVLDYCIQIDSWKRNAWGDTVGFSYLDTNLANNTCCKQVVVMPAPQATAIADLEGTLASFTIYPNPATHTLYLRAGPGFRSGDVQLSIFDLMGRNLLVKHAPALQWSQGVASIDVAQLPAGCYQLNVYTPKEIRTKKFAVYK